MGTKVHWLNVFVSGTGLVLIGGCVLRLPARVIDPVEPVRYVLAAPPERHDIWEKVSFTGFIEPKLLMNVHFLISGRIEACRLKEAQKVKAGEEICRLDMSGINLEVARSANSVKAARNVLETNLPEKQKALFEAGVIGQSEFEQVRLQSESAKAQYADSASLHEMARKKQREHLLIAPWDGTLMRLLVKPGQPVIPEMPIAVLSDERTVQVGVDVHASFFSKLGVGATALVTNVSSVVLKEPVEMIVAEKATSVSPDTQSFHVTMRPARVEGSRGLTPGMLVGGDLLIQRHEGALCIPQAALLSWKQSGVATVHVMDGGRVALRRVVTGIFEGQEVEIREGLAEGDRVILGAAADLSEGMRVEAAPPGSPAL